MDGTSNQFSPAESTTLYSPYQCGLTDKAVNYTAEDEKSAMRLTLDIDGCPQDCNQYDYSCAEVASLEQLSYGSYSCVMKTSSIPGVISSCYASNNGKGEAYADIYFKVPGNASKIIIGCNSAGIKFEKTITNAFFSQTDFNTFTFNFTNKRITWNVGGNLLAEKTSDWSGDKSIPKPPLKLFAAIYNDVNKSIKNSSLPTSLFIDSMSYDPVPCTNDTSSEDSTDEWHWEAGSPLWYFTSNCTLWRPEWVYNESFVEPWEDSSYSFRKIEDYTLPKRGQVSISFDLKENTGIFFQSTEPFPVHRHKYLTFWINGGVLGNQQMIIYFIGLNRTKVASLNLGDYVRGGLKPYRWYKVILPLKGLQINPPETKYLTGFLFSEAYKQYMGQMFVDDIFFSNGSICLNREKSIAYFKDGQLVGGGAGNYSTGSVDFKSRGQLYRKNPTIEWRVMSSNKMVMSFENGTISTTDYDAFLISLYYIPDNQFQWNGEASDEPHTSPPREINAKVQVQVNMNYYQGVGLSEYVGGEFPTKRWVDLTIPFYDLSCGDAEEIQAIQIISEEGQYQGVVYIGRIEAVKFADPPKEAESFASKTQISSIFIILSLLLLLL
ncbi:hypothetical protein DLAC_11483 [Tieghemostelium lacteum]|uniref:GH16 domain-containing protein n=1 Tax=Tieghemostelium lacteum TaxID=361077 RepID=A0A152A657_TIELA|nr:hypothetical protein DLAC_11483 [Tieghemostelium lacteum]|eukprot:KYR01595.1 hypothetical protein DLAC_11483 [Tieghemostelium lacteum]